MKNYLVWGQWVLIKKVRVLHHRRFHYEVYLDECQNSAQILDWVAQISRKGDDVFPKEDIGDLVRALDDILDLQGCICSCGHDKSISLEQIKEKVKVARRSRLSLEEKIEDEQDEIEAKISAAKKRLNAGRK
jgi:hypothetical protein